MDPIQSYDLIFEHVKNLNIITDAFYILAAIYSYIVFLQIHDIRLFITFLMYLFSGVISILHHRTVPKHLFKYDMFTAGISILYSILITTQSIFDGKINILIYTLTFILLGSSFINYYYSQKYESYLNSFPENSVEYKYYSIMKYIHHTLWHILSGICACTVPFAMYVQ